jgi:hypothetical protein
MKLLSTIKTLLIRSPAKIWELLEFDEDRSLTVGSYQPEQDECDRCEVFGTSLWELPMLNRHADPRVRLWVRELAALHRETRKSTMVLQ